MTNQTDDAVVDADVVTDTPDTSVPDTSTPDTTTPDTNLASTENGAEIMLELESTIKSHIALIDKGKAELKKQREMMESALMNDETYRLHNEEAKKAAKVKMATKYQIMQQPQNKALAEKVKELAQETKDLDGALSDYLREYQRMSGTNEIETNEGEVREIVYVAKLIKKSDKHRG